MPIQAQCPHCQKAYRLKDEAAGKKAICQNPECRKPFIVDAIPLPPRAKSPKPKIAKRDAEAMAAAAYAEPGEVIPEDSRSIALTCTSCEHKWDVAWAMQGKNVLCPDCRTRQKVPDQKRLKPSDWRDTSSRPSMARVEQLEGVVASSEARGVSGSSLIQSGVLKEEIEPRPKWHYAVVIGVPLVAIAALAFGIVYLMRTSQDNKQGQFMADALKDMQEGTDPPLPAAEAPLFRAALSIAAGEYAARQDKPEQSKEAIGHFERARQELTAAPSSAARDFLFGELAVAQVNLGGDDEAVLGQKKIRWKPQPPRPGKGNAEGKVYNVQEEIRSTLEKMQKQQCPKDARLYAIRRVASELAKRGQTDSITESIFGQVFAEAEKPEAVALVGLEIFKVNRDDGRLAEVKAETKSSGTAQSYFEIADKPQESLEKSKRSTDSPDSRLRTIVLVAEWSTNPASAMESAVDVLASSEANRRDSAPIGELTLVRLAAQAGRANQTDKAETFANRAAKPDTKVWAKAESLRNRLPVGYTGKAAEESLAEVPVDPKDFKAGHAWARLALARHNASATGDQSKPTVANYDRWGKGTFKPFGLGGLALGLQDREKR